MPKIYLKKVAGNPKKCNADYKHYYAPCYFKYKPCAKYVSICCNGFIFIEFDPEEADAKNKS